MANLNKVMLIGNLTADPELRYTPSGQAVCDLRIAVNNKYKTQTGEWKEDPCFLNVTVWARQAEYCAEYLKKGRSIFVEGRLKMNTWTSKEGQKRTGYSVNAQTVQFLDAKGTGGGAHAAPALEPPASEEPGPAPDNQSAGPDEEIPF